MRVQVTDIGSFSEDENEVAVSHKFSKSKVEGKFRLHMKKHSSVFCCESLDTGGHDNPIVNMVLSCG